MAKGKFLNVGGIRKPKIFKSTSKSYSVAKRGSRRVAKPVKLSYRQRGGALQSQGSHSFKSDRVLNSRGSAVAIARKGKNKLKRKRVKDVKVSKSLKLKIDKVMEGECYKGYYQETNYGYVTKPGDQAQTCDMIGNCYSPNIGVFFSYVQILDAFSVLWHGKVPTQSKSLGGGDVNLQFSAKQFKGKVVKQWATVKWRNNDQRYYTINLYACRNKVNRAASNLNDHTNTQPDQEWKYALASEYDGTAQGLSANVTQVLTTSLYATPYLSKSFMNNWEVEMTKIELAPGEEYVYTLEGPSMEYDFRKIWQGDIALDKQKQEVSLMYTAYVNQTGSFKAGLTGYHFGRYSSAEQTQAVTGYLQYETNMYYKLECPKNAGSAFSNAGSLTQSIVPAANRYMDLKFQRDAYGIVNYGQSQDAGAFPLSVLVENPTTNTFG